MNYIIGIDVGIGSVGWAVINLDKRRIEDCGVRIFESGENTKRSASTCQERRTARGIRRLIRRKSHRKSRLKKHLEIIGLTTEAKINEYYLNGSSNVIALRVKAISEKVSPEELTACLIHICNYRGYKDFYSTGHADSEFLTKEEKKEAEAENAALDHIKELMKKGNYRTPAEIIYYDPEFKGESGEIRKYHNSAFSDHINLISRDMLEHEVDLILEKQREFYDCLNDKSINTIKDIVFSQRTFEEGPGLPNKNDTDDAFRKYTGFLDSIGKCRFYSEENRGSRFTAIADIYALVNTLSQYKYFDSNGEFCFNGDIAHALISFALEKGSMTKNDVKTVAKRFKIKINDSGTSDTPITKCFRYLKSVKPIFEDEGYNWNELIKDYTDTENNLLNKIGITLSQYITPKIREKKLRELPISECLVTKLAGMKLTGTTNVSYKYMTDSINAFLDGDIYGKYQAAFIKQNSTVTDENRKPKKLPPFRSEDDCEFYKNPVVFRAINETRKVINAIIDKYGYPCAVNIETADDVNRSFANRAADNARNAKNEKENDRIRKEIADTINEPIDSIRPVQIENTSFGKLRVTIVCIQEKKLT